MSPMGALVGSGVGFGLILFFRFLKMRPVPLLAGTAMFVVAAFSGVAGIGLLLPILDTVAGSADSGSGGLSDLYRSAIEAVGLSPTLGTLLIIFAAVSILEAFLRLSYSSFLIRLGEVFRYELRTLVLSRTTRGSWREIAEGHSADALNAIVTEASYAAKAFVFTIKLLGAGFVVLAYLALAFTISPVLCIGVLSALGVSFIIARPFLRRGQSVATMNVDNNSVLVEALTEHFAALRFLRSMALDATARAWLGKLFLKSSNYFQKLLVYPLQLRFAFDIVVIVAICAITFIAIDVLDFAIGEVAVLIGVFIRIAPHIVDIQQSFQFLAIAQPSWRLVSDLMATTPAAPARLEGKVKVGFDVGLELRDVTVQTRSGPVFKGVNFQLDANGSALLLGPSGSGKSTVIDLIVGLQMPDAGQVLIDGQPTLHMDLEHYRNHIALLPQSPVLFHDTIAANIRIADPDASDEDVWAALEAAGAAEFVNARDGKLAALVGDGGTALSGGQRQRIALARALIRKPRLLILDEPTSALDPVSEKFILDSVQSMRGKFAMLIVSHRPELIDFVDQRIDMKSFHRTSQ